MENLKNNNCLEMEEITSLFIKQSTTDDYGIFFHICAFVSSSSADEKKNFYNFVLIWISDPQDDYFVQKSF